MSIAAYRKHVAMRLAATNYALRHIPEDRSRYHTCWGSWHTPHTTDLPFRHGIDLRLTVKAQAYAVEAAGMSATNWIGNSGKKSNCLRARSTSLASSPTRPRL
jgi:hypothetical protein